MHVCRTVLAILISLSILTYTPSTQAIWGFFAAAFTAAVQVGVALIGSLFSSGGGYRPSNSGYVDRSSHRRQGETEKFQLDRLDSYFDLNNREDLSYQIDYVISRMADLLNAKNLREIKRHVTDPIVMRFITVFLNEDINLNPLLKRLPYYDRIKQLSEGAGTSPSNFVRSKLFEQLKAHNFDVSALQEAAKQNRLASRVSLLDGTFSFAADLVKSTFEGLGLTTAAVSKGIADSKVGLDVNKSDFLKTIAKAIETYIDRLPAERKQAINIEFMKLKKPSEAEVIAFGLLHTGPFMLKLVQLIAQNVESPTLRQGLKAAEENVKPMDENTVRSAIESELNKKGLSFRSVFDSVDWTPIHSGSVAQVHEARVKVIVNGRRLTRRVAIKVYRPEYVAKLNEDIVIMGSASTDFNFGQAFVGPILQSMLREANGTEEAANISRIGPGYERPDQGITSVKLAYPDQLPNSEGLIFMDFIQGATSLGDFSSRGPKTLSAKLELLRKYYGVWLTRVLFEDGEFHADPHGGNGLVRKNGKLVIVDYGNVATLAQPTRDSLSSLFDHVATGDLRRAKMDVDKLIPDFATVSEEEFSARLFQSEVDIPASLRMIVELAVEKKIPIPIELAQFARAMHLFGNQFEALSAEIGSVAKDDASPEILAEGMAKITGRVLFLAKYGVADSPNSSASACSGAAAK